MVTVLILFIAYLLGSIPSGLIAGKIIKGIDIREYGSGNLGATNTFRTLGMKAGLIVTFADILKGTLATALPDLFGSELHPLIAGVCAAIGHIFPIFASFRGGKAVATSGGVLLYYAPVMFLILLTVFCITLIISRYVSLSSIMAAIAALTYAIIDGDPSLLIVIIILAIVVIYRHRSNIIRIKNGTEPKVNFSKKKNT